MPSPTSSPASTWRRHGVRRQRAEARGADRHQLHDHHELYFDGLGGEGDPTGALAEQIAKDFGSVARWKTEFAAVGKALGGGSGWVLLTWSPHDKRLVNSWAADHTMTIAGGRPILALDMYEHAYAMDYGAKAASYVDAFMQGIRWNNAAGLYERYSKQLDHRWGRATPVARLLISYGPRILRAHERTGSSRHRRT